MKEQPGDDLFDWAKKKEPEVPQKKVLDSDDGLFDKCPQCDMLGRSCEYHHRDTDKNSTIKTNRTETITTAPDLTPEDIASSDRIADHEVELWEIEKKETRPLTESEIEEWKIQAAKDIKSA